MPTSARTVSVGTQTVNDYKIHFRHDTLRGMVEFSPLNDCTRIAASADYIPIVERVLGKPGTQDTVSSYKIWKTNDPYKVIVIVNEVSKGKS